MASIGGPNIVESGLVLSLDATNTKSYPGSGTTWFDKSGNGNNGTLANGPTFSSANGGSIVFDGTDDVISTTLVQTFVNELTVETWYRGTKSTRNHLWNFYGSNLHCNFNDTGRTLWVYWEGGGTPAIRFTSPNFTDGNIKHLVFRHSGSVNQVYLDGQLLVPQETAGTQTFTGVGGSGYDLASTGPFSGNIYTNRVYNKALTAAEILQNYNATKSRFGL
jgi:prepilin-type processing-associated H-X9-DG protein